MKLCIHVRPRDDGQGWAVDVFDGRRAWSKTHIGEQPLNKAEAHRLAHKLRDPKFYTSRTKRAVNSLTVERGPKVVARRLDEINEIEKLVTSNESLLGLKLDGVRAEIEAVRTLWKNHTSRGAMLDVG